MYFQRQKIRIYNPHNRIAPKTKDNYHVFLLLRDRLAQKTKNDDEVAFVRQVPQHPRDRLAQKQNIMMMWFLLNKFHNIHMIG